MKITFTREEVEEIVLAHVAQNYGAAKLNTVEVFDRYSGAFCQVTYVEPEPVAAPVAASVEGE